MTTTFPAPNRLGPRVPLPPRPTPGQTVFALGTRPRPAVGIPGVTAPIPSRADAAAVPFVRTALSPAATACGGLDLDATAEFARIPPPRVAGDDVVAAPAPARSTHASQRRALPAASVVVAILIVLFGITGAAVGLAAADRLTTNAGASGIGAPAAAPAPHRTAGPAAVRVAAVTPEQR